MAYEADYDPSCKGDNCWQVQLHFPRSERFRYGHQLAVMVFRVLASEAVMACLEAYPSAVIESVNRIGSRAVILPVPDQ